MKDLLKYLLVFGLIILFGCKSEKATDPNPITVPPISDNETQAPTGNEQYLTLKSNYIFDQNKLSTFELNLSEDELAKIDADPTAEEYVEGSLTFEGETLNKVGIRYKGSIGAYVGCVSGRDWTNPSGHKTCTKLSMKIKINWEDSDDKFYGLKKLQFHAMNLDKSQMRDRLGYWLFREMGVPAPRAVHARLLINGKYMGLFSLVEQIDGRFTRHNFEDGKGNLYKEIWPLKSNGSPHSSQTYLEHLKTNEDENPSTDQILTFAQEISKAKEEDLQAVITKWMNLREIMSYIVVDRAIRNDDGAFHWYCNNGDCSPHNFYWYEDPSAKTMHLIPWDLDNAFENIIFNANPVTPIADQWGEISANCQPFKSGAFGIYQLSAACDKLTGGWASFTNEYQQLKQEFLDAPFSETIVNEQLDKWTEQIRAATIEASETHADALKINLWETNLTTLNTQLRTARGH